MQMALDLYMLGLVVQDMSKSLEFYRRLGLAIPEGIEQETHGQVKVGTGLTFFLDSNPARWDPGFVKKPDPGPREATGGFPLVLEFYLGEQAAVEAKYQELTSLGYQSHRAPYATPFGMCFALVDDPDGNTILLSGDLKEHPTTL